MLKLVFAEAGPSPTVEVGPLPEIRIDGETMRATRDGEVLGRHHKHEWITNVSKVSGKTDISWLALDYLLYRLGQHKPINQKRG